MTTEAGHVERKFEATDSRGPKEGHGGELDRGEDHQASGLGLRHGDERASPFDSAEDLADAYMEDDAPLVDQVNSLIRWQVTKAATSGFLSGLGGLITLPIAIPANVGVVVVVQLRMIAAIAFMGGYDVKNDRVKTFAYACLAAGTAPRKSYGRQELSSARNSRSAASAGFRALCSRRSTRRWASGY